jgi:FixJ family two-component response regulator
MKLIRVFETETQDSGIEIKEFRIIQDGFLSAISRVKSSESEKALMVSELEKISLASQVAHDIRSPLEMLKGIKEDLALLPQDSRRRIMLGINRIEEISFNLLRANKDDLILNNETISQELLSLVLSVITEKKIEFKKNEKVDIFDKFSSNSYGLFSKLNRSKIKSIISNIINNSIQAMGENSGTVEIYLDSLSHHNVIRIKDNGSGMSPEVSSKIFTKGFTTKEAGNGIGLANAKLDIEALGGTLTFETELGKGTTFFITLPKSEKSSTFIGAINASKYDKIIVLDDDPAFHDVWSNRLKGLESKTEHIFSVQDMLLKYSGLDSKTLLLTDFELMDKEFDGLDVIQKLNHSKDSILVTARSEENDIQDRCTKAGVKLLSKSLVNYIEIISDKVQTNIPQIVLIDDDKMIQIDWFYYCEKESVPFKGFRSVEKFLEIAHTLDKETIIFIDSNLGHDIKGEVESEKIFNLGFKNIYLATGYQKEDIQKPHWIIDIFSKSPDSIKRIIA